jgi:hypothetical protein
MLYVFSTLLGYKFLGVPMFLASRLDATANAQGGMGVLARFSNLGIVCLYCFFVFYHRKSRDKLVKLCNLVTIISFTLFSILSGGKSAFILIAFVYFCFVIANKDEVGMLYDKLKKKQYYLLFFGFMAAFAVVMLSTGNVENTIYSLLYRIVGSGDVYWLAYPNEMIESVPYRNPFVVLFQSFLGFFRIMPHSDFPEPIGYTLSSFFYDKTSLTGANARHNIFGYVYFGAYWSVLFSFVLGCLIAFIRQCLISLKRQGNICKLVIILLYVTIPGLESDPTLYFSYLTDIFVVSSFVIVPSILLYYTNYAKNRDIISYIQ